MPSWWSSWGLSWACSFCAAGTMAQSEHSPRWVVFPGFLSISGCYRANASSAQVCSQSTQNHMLYFKLIPRYRRSSTKNKMLPRYLFPSALLATCLISSSHAFVPASKVPPGEPTAAVSSSSTDAILKLSARGSSSSKSALQMAKKKKKAPVASNKIQVKMLKYVEGTGSVSSYFVAQTYMCSKEKSACILRATFSYCVHVAHCSPPIFFDVSSLCI